MSKMLLTLAGLMLGTSLASAQAQSQSPYRLDGVEAVQVEIKDNTDEQCWPRPAATREAVELVLRSAGIAVGADAEGAHPHTLRLRAMGYSQSFPARCVVALRASLYRIEQVSDATAASGGPANPRLVHALYDSTSALVTDTRSNIQSQINETATEITTALANDILRQRAGDAPR